MVKHVKFKGSSFVHKVSEREFQQLKRNKQPMDVIKSVTRKKKQPSRDEWGCGFF